MLDALLSPSGALTVSAIAVFAAVVVVALRLFLSYKTRDSIYKMYHFW